MNLPVITEIARYFKDELKYEHFRYAAFCRSDISTSTRAGIHADGLLKEQEIYNVFDTQAFLNRPPEVAITDRAGLAGIAYWI
jgi:isopropylmalate/homocitrate/citramalate synthase